LQGKIHRFAKNSGLTGREQMYFFGENIGFGVVLSSLVAWMGRKIFFTLDNNHLQLILT